MIGIEITHRSFYKGSKLVWHNYCFIHTQKWKSTKSDLGLSHSYKNKKDGYRQQNVRQRQKLISIIDYDVCILEYLQPFWRLSTSKNGLTLISGYGVKVIEKARFDRPFVTFY